MFRIKESVLNNASNNVGQTEEARVSSRYSINANADNLDPEGPGYIRLGGSPEKARFHTTPALGILTTLGINAEALRQAGPIEQDLQRLLAKELSFLRYFRWAFVDNFAEKILQGLILNKQDVSQEEINFCSRMIRQVPSGRSLLLHEVWGLRKVYAARGFVLTTEMVLIGAVKAFITVSLSYRLYNWLTTDDQNFLEFTTLFDDNTKKGASSFARLLLSSFDPKWLYLLLASPAIAGALKGLWDTRKSQLLTEHAITQLQEVVDYHIGRFHEQLLIQLSKMSPITSSFHPKDLRNPLVERFLPV